MTWSKRAGGIVVWPKGAFDDEPDPDELVHESVRWVFDDERDAAIRTYDRMGLPIDEIAARVSANERTVRRVLEHSNHSPRRAAASP